MTEAGSGSRLQPSLTNYMTIDREPGPSPDLLSAPDHPGSTLDYHVGPLRSQEGIELGVVIYIGLCVILCEGGGGFHESSSFLIIFFYMEQKGLALANF